MALESQLHRRSGAVAADDSALPLPLPGVSLHAL